MAEDAGKDRGRRTRDEDLLKDVEEQKVGLRARPLERICCRRGLLQGHRGRARSTEAHAHVFVREAAGAERDPRPPHAAAVAAAIA